MINTFADRHIGPTPEEAVAMATSLGYDSLDALIDATVPGGIRQKEPLHFSDTPEALSEPEALAQLKSIFEKNTVARSVIGQGYYGTYTPPVIQRNILENPGWYTAYTPYQAEIAQGRLEALLNFQTMVADLTGMPVANASLLDEATAAAEAMTMAAGTKSKATKFLVSERCHPQTIAVLKTRAEPVGIELVIGDEKGFTFNETTIGVLLQYPCTEGSVRDYSAIASAATEAKATVVVASDLLALTLLKPPGEWGADIVIGSAQRFGVPLGYGGPHAAFMACTDKMKRRLPGRLVGVSHDADGRPALRLALQTREQHIRREKATSNICTAQVLLAVMAGMYAVYHGPEGIKAIAQKIHAQTCDLAFRLKSEGFEISHKSFFDTIVVDRAPAADVNSRQFPDGRVGLSLDETSNDALLDSIAPAVSKSLKNAIPRSLARTSDFLTHPVFHRYHTETEMLRYLRRLEGKDIALNWSMIPLGSCTMKLNATAEMMPVTWNEVGGVHPFAPAEQAVGFAEMAKQLEQWLCDITGFNAVSLQPNAGSQGEFAGLLAIRRFHQSQGNHSRDVCLIPTSAHGTNPASAVMAGMRVVPVKCDDNGNIDVEDIRAKAAEHADQLAALMITYPSTHGVFEETVIEICEVIHQHGGQVYLDGANLNAMVGIARPGDIGGDVCHMNLHKTFCIPHGGGGPGVGPIGVAEHLAPFLPDDTAPVSAADLGSASILTISWMYIAMMAGEGLTRATKTAILSANYIAKRLAPYYPVLYKGKNGLVAHECIIDLRPLKDTTGVEVEDVAKRLIDYGFHAPTMSWPVAGTLMIEPTESESRAELDRFCEAMIKIHAEIHTHLDLLKNAPHPAETLLSENWDRSYTPAAAAYPADWTRDAKYWPPVSRIDNVYGDRNLICSCEGMESYREAT